jgi:hypothetical protein
MPGLWQLLYVSTAVVVALVLMYAGVHFRSAYLGVAADYDDRNRFLQDPAAVRYRCLADVLHESRKRVEEGVWAPAFDIFVRTSRLYKIVSLDDYRVLASVVIVACAALYFLKTTLSEMYETNRLAKQAEVLADAMGKRNDMLHEWRQSDIQGAISKRQTRSMQQQQPQKKPAETKLTPPPIAAQ